MINRNKGKPLVRETNAGNAFHVNIRIQDNLVASELERFPPIFGILLNLARMLSIQGIAVGSFRDCLPVSIKGDHFGRASTTVNT